MRPTTVRVSPQEKTALKRTFNQRAVESNQSYRAIGEPVRYSEPPLFNLARLRVMEGAFEELQTWGNPVEATDAERAWKGGYIPAFLFEFLTTRKNESGQGDTSIATDVGKRKLANLLYRRLEKSNLTERLAGVQREDKELIPTIILGGVNELPQHATYDVVCSTDNAIAMAQLGRGFDDYTRAIRGLRLKFGAKEVHPALLKDITNGVAREQSLSAIELKTNPANTAAETEVFSAIAGNSNIKQLSVIGNLATRHRHGVITALSNASLENVEIEADEESCLRLLDCVADAQGSLNRNLRVEVQAVICVRLATWNAAVIRLAESGSTKILHLPRYIKRCLTPETRQVAKTAKMDIVGTGGPF